MAENSPNGAHPQGRDTSSSPSTKDDERNGDETQASAAFTSLTNVLKNEKRIRTKRNRKKTEQAETNGDGTVGAANQPHGLSKSRAQDVLDHFTFSNLSPPTEEQLKYSNNLREVQVKQIGFNHDAGLDGTSVGIDVKPDANVKHISNKGHSAAYDGGTNKSLSSATSSHNSASNPPNGAHPKVKDENFLVTKDNKRNDKKLWIGTENAPVYITQKNEKKKRSKKNKKKKGAEGATADDGAVSVSQGTQSSPARLVEDEAPVHIPCLEPKQKLLLNQNYISLLNKRSAKNPKALFFCKLCKYHCDNLPVVENHINDKRHQKAVEEEAERITLLHLPSPTEEQLKFITVLLEEQVKQFGLSQDDLLVRGQIANILNESIVAEMPDFVVRLYGSSASGFGLKTSDVNLELCVPPEKSAPKGLSAAYDIIASKDIYSEVERDFTAEIPAVRFVDKSTNLSCALTLSNNHSFKIAELFSKYASINENVWKLGIAFRFWAQKCRLDNSDDGMWPPYAFPFLVIYFLQQLKEPVLPVLHELVESTDTENASEIYMDPKDFQTVWKSQNTMTLGELWLELFRFYVLDFDIFGRVVCIQQSSPFLRGDNLKRWIGRKIAIKDPFLPKRNVSRSMTSKLSFEYCLTCFRNTYKYFGILQTKTGPIFNRILIFQDKSEETKTLYKTLNDTCDAIRKTMKKHPYFTKINAGHGLEDNLMKMEQSICNSDFSYTIVSPPLAQELYSKFNTNYIHYEFENKNFIGDQVFPEICSSCLKEGHNKHQCTEVDLPEFNITLPPLEEPYKEILDKLCSEILEKWATNQEEIEVRKDIISDIQKYILMYYPTAKLELFGSSCNGFGLTKSDIDICLTFTNSETGKEHDFVKLIEDLQEKLKKFGPLQNLVPITTAKVPILKFYHAHSTLDGDISIYNTLGQQNTRLLRTYAEIDPRVRMLGYMIKRFAKVCNMCDASRGSLSSYAYIIMLIYFLQQCSPPVLPILQELSDTEPKPRRIVEDCDTYFFDDLENLEKLWPEYGKNTSSVGELWIQLLQFYSGVFDFSTFVISIRQKEELQRFEKLWTSKCMAIEDPFDLSHNLGAGLSRKMHVYIIKSFRMGYVHFASPATDITALKCPEEYYFKSKKLTNGEPPNDRGCRICKKIGHLCKDCPQRKQSRNKRTGPRFGIGSGGGGGGGGGVGGVGGVVAGKRIESPTTQNMGFLRNFNPTNSPLRGYNSPFVPPHSPIRSAQYSRGRYHNPGELPPYRGGYSPVYGNFRSQDKSGMRYGMPRASPPFKPCPTSMDSVRRNGASSLPPFGTIQGGMDLKSHERPLFDNKRVSFTNKQLPANTPRRAMDRTQINNERKLEECFELVQHLGLIQNRNLPMDLNQLKPRGDIHHHHVPKVPNEAVVVVDVCPGRR